MCDLLHIYQSSIFTSTVRFFDPSGTGFPFDIFKTRFLTNERSKEPVCLKTYTKTRSLIVNKLEPFWRAVVPAHHFHFVHLSQRGEISVRFWKFGSQCNNCAKLREFFKGLSQDGAHHVMGDGRTLLKISALHPLSQIYLYGKYL
jgi:hypothetical protein